MLNDDSSSSSDDPFLINGGVKGHVSMYAQLAIARRQYDHKHKSNSPNEQVESTVLKSANSDKTTHIVDLVEKSKSTMVVTISSDSDSDEEPSLSLRESLRARRRRGGAKRPRDTQSKGSARGNGKNGSDNREDDNDVFAISNDELDATTSRTVDRGRKRRARNILADLDADDDPAVPGSPLNASDVRIRNVLQAAREAARMTDVATLEAEAEQAAREAAAAAAEFENAKASERDRLSQDKTVHSEKDSADKVDSTPVVLKVRCGRHIHKLRIRKTDRLLKMLVPFCKKFGLDASSAVMQVDGESIGKNDTPLTHDLEDSMMVDVIIQKRN